MYGSVYALTGTRNTRIIGHGDDRGFNHMPTEKRGFLLVQAGLEVGHELHCVVLVIISTCLDARVCLESEMKARSAWFQLRYAG